MGKDIFIEIAVTDDARKIQAIHKLAFQHCYNQYKFCPPYDATEEDIKRCMENYHVYKVMKNNTMIGTVFVYNTLENEYDLDTISLLPTYQNQGIGTKVMELIEEKYRDALVWTLQTPEGEFKNRYFYEKLGYELSGIITINGDLNLAQYRKETKNKKLIINST